MHAPDFQVFQNSVGAVAFERLTTRSRNSVSSWEELRAILQAFGTSGDPRLVKARDEGLSAFGHFSSSEELLAVVLLMVADQGDLADRIAAKIGWWSSYDRTTGDSARRVVGYLMSSL